MNRICLVGNLTRDVQLEYSSEGVAYARFAIAVDNPFAKQGEEPLYVNITTFRATAESCAQYISTGHLVGIDGKLTSNTYNDSQTGQRRRSYSVVADIVRFLGVPKNKEGGQQQQSRQADQQSPQAGAQQQGGQHQGQSQSGQQRGAQQQGGQSQGRQQRPPQPADNGFDDVPF